MPPYTNYRTHDDDRHPRARPTDARGGAILFDHAAKPGTGKEAAQDLLRIDEDFARKDIEAAGFAFDGESRVLRNPADDRTMTVFDDRIRRRTDRFIYRFTKRKARH